LVPRSLFGLGLHRPLRFSHCPVSGKMVSFRTTHPGLLLPSRVKPSRSRPVSEVEFRPGLSPMRFVSPTAFSRRRAATYIPGVPRPGLRYLLSVSHALEVLIRPSPAGLVSCRSRSWGLCLSRLLPVQSRTSSRTPLPSCCYPEHESYSWNQLQGLAPRTGPCHDRFPPIRTATSIGFLPP
jgi:hypothetical protein